MVNDLLRHFEDDGSIETDRNHFYLFQPQPKPRRNQEMTM